MLARLGGGGARHGALGLGRLFGGVLALGAPETLFVILAIASPVARGACALGPASNLSVMLAVSAVARGACALGGVGSLLGFVIFGACSVAPMGVRCP